MDYKETIQKRLKELPEVLQSFVLDEKWRIDAERIGKQFNFDENKYASFENEIFVVLIVLEPKEDFEKTIKNTLELDSNVAGWVAEDVKKNIFDKITKEIDIMIKKENPTDTEETPTPKNVGSSFEQIILNQAKAMKEVVPTNLPTGQESEVKTEEKPRTTQSYGAGNDPYRESIN